MHIDLVFPRFKSLSGAERSLLEWAAGLARHGHRVRLVCHQFDDSCQALVAPGVTLAVTRSRLDWWRSHYMNALVEYLRSPALLRCMRADADAYVLCGGPSLPIAALLKILPRWRGSVVYHCFEPPRVLYQDRVSILRSVGAMRLLLAPLIALYRPVDRWFVRAVDAITTAGPYSAGRIASVYGRHAQPLTNGLDHAALDAARAIAVAPRFSLLTVNTLHPRKRVDLVLCALALLVHPIGQARTPPTLQVVGAGPERRRLESLARQLGLQERVRFAGFVADDDLPHHYCAALCYVHAAREESLGLTVGEAAYCGLPVVAVAEGGVVDNVDDGRTGRLVDATAPAIAAAIEEILSSPAKAREMGAAGRDLVASRFSWQRGAEELLETIRSTI
jgi:glycosyltransferase involved in cell wall biosynthesis